MGKNRSFRKRYGKIFIVAGILIAVAAWRLTAAPSLEQAEALLQSLTADALSFHLQATLTLPDGAVTPYLDLQGQQMGETSQLEGTVLGQPVQMSYQNGILTRVLPDGERRECPVADLGDLGELYAELLPGTAFLYAGVTDYTAVRRQGGWSLHLTPQEAAGWVGDYFQQVGYVLETGPLGRRLQAVELRARERINGEAWLQLRLEIL